MSRYTDILAYDLAVRVRSFKTVLVEGVTDKNVLSNFFLVKNYSAEHRARYYIDDVSIIGGSDLSSLGNKEKVLSVAERLSARNDQLRYLVDREWDGVEIDKLANAAPDLRVEKTFITRGHSIENYWFSADAIVSFLQQSAAVGITVEILLELRTRFDAIIRFSAAYSLAARMGEVITKMDDLLNHTDIILDESGFKIMDSLNVKLRARQSEFDVVNAFNEQLAALIPHAVTDLRWVCHGHLGEQAIRSCVARIAVNFGVEPSVVQLIEFGDKPHKLKHDSHHLTTCCKEAIAPLDELLTWVRSGV